MMWYRYSQNKNNNLSYFIIIFQSILIKSPWLAFDSNIIQMYRLCFAHEACFSIKPKNFLCAPGRAIRLNPNLSDPNLLFQKPNQFNKNARNFKVNYPIVSLDKFITAYMLKMFILVFSHSVHSLSTSELLILPVYKNLLLGFSGGCGFSSFKFNLKICFSH